MLKLKYMGVGMFLFLGIILSAGNLNAQEVTVCGVVKSFNKYYLKGVKVTARKSDQTALTDSSGRFCIGCEKKDKLVFKAKGFYTERVRIKNDDSVKVNMAFKGGKKNRQIATGLGYIDQSDLTYAISQLNNEDKNFGKYSSIYDLLQGELTGVDVVNQTIVIRGMNSANSEPLFVVDGTYRNSISHIHPLDVKSVNVIKDGGTAMYGSRGANGVIIIKTKRE